MSFALTISLRLSIIMPFPIRHKLPAVQNGVTKLSTLHIFTSMFKFKIGTEIAFSPVVFLQGSPEPTLLFLFPFFDPLLGW